VDEFSPPERICQVRVRGTASIEEHDPGRVKEIYSGYLGDSIDRWPGHLRDRLADTDFVVWSVLPRRGLVVAYPNFEGEEMRWTRPEQSLLP